jgi:hypothetical protein
MFESHEELVKHVNENLKDLIGNPDGLSYLNLTRMIYPFVDELIFNEKDTSFFREVAAACRQLGIAAGCQLHDLDLIDTLRELDEVLCINPRQGLEKALAPKAIQATYDFSAWARDGFTQSLVTYHLPKSRELVLMPRNPKAIEAAIRADERDGRATSFSFLRYLNSSNFRRVFA